MSEEVQRKRDTPESEAGSRLQAVSTEPNVELEPTQRRIMTWAEVGRLTNRATQAPLFLFIFERQREKEADIESKAGCQAPSCQHRAQCRAQTHKL